jgi:cell division protein FtsW
LGTAFVLVFIGFWVGVCGGASIRSIVLVLLVGGLVFAFVMIKEPYRVQRFTKHYQMWDPQNANGVGKQPTDSATSIALAGPMGVGPGNGIAKTRIKTGEETDFVMTTIEEEGGLVGGFAVWGPLTAIVARLLWIASLVKDRYAQLVLLGCAVWIGVQTAVNMMVANAVLPTVGIPCPFVSAGGSSLVALWIGIAICQTANRRESKRVA